LLLVNGGSEAGTTVALRIAEALEEPIRLGDIKIGIEASIGIASAVDGEEPTLEELLRRADIAMYRAKVDRSGFAHFAPGNDNGTPDDLTLIGELRQALDCEELILHYQPKVAVDDGRLLGVEVLVRWQHPTRGLLLPDDFIAVAETSALIKRLTAVVVDMALRFCRTWLDQGVRMPAAVNISARSLFDPAFANSIGALLAQHGVPSDLLTLELTEGTIMAHPGRALESLHELRAMGIRLSIDDYGTGYSSMSYLKNLPVDELKIDRSFVSRLTSDHNDAVLAQSAIDLGHNLGLSVVAEGIEDEATLSELRALGADAAQGYHLGRPMPEDILRDWVANRTTTDAPSHT
jgi:EAL domain-containing protein (putative c-di-GMP-specific phosphodiesterase class I)